MAKIMESKCEKTSPSTRTASLLLIVYISIMLFIPSLSTADLFKALRIADGDSIKVENNRKASATRIVPNDAQETYKKKNEPAKIFSQIFMKSLVGYFICISEFALRL